MSKITLFSVIIIIIVVVATLFLFRKRPSNQYPSLTFEGPDYQLELQSLPPKQAQPSLEITPGPHGATIEFVAEYPMEICDPNIIKYDRYDEEKVLIVTHTVNQVEGDETPSSCKDPRWYVLKGLITQLNSDTEYTLRIFKVEGDELIKKVKTTHEPASEI